MDHLRQMLGALPVEIVPVDLSSALWGVLDDARKLGLSACDAACLGLAALRGVPLATVDEQMRAACREAGVELLDL